MKSPFASLLVLSALCSSLHSNHFFAPDTGANASTGAAAFDEAESGADGDDTGDGETDAADDATSGATSTSTGTGPASTTKPTKSAKTQEEVVANTQLVQLLTTYDELKDKTVSVYVDMAELIGKDNLSRPIVVKSIMEARNISYENAQPVASRVMKLAKDPETIKALREKRITTSEVFYNRKPGGSKTGTAGGQTDPKNVGGGAKGDKQAETKEKRYERGLGEFTEVCKATGYSRKSILMGVEASLKNAGIK